MKVGILTFHFATNYGAVYQAFALKTALRGLGHEACVINYCPSQMRGGWDYHFYKSLQSIHWDSVKKLDIKSVLMESYNYLKFLLYDNRGVRRKFEGFEKFVSDYLCDSTERITSVSSLREILKQYDAVVCGSDQIWNPNITKGFDDVYFTGCLTVKRKVSYAASIGDITILNDVSVKKQFVEKVKNFDFVSVRENNLKKLLITNGLECSCHCDPTFLIPQNEYDRVVNNEPINNESYILVYRLLHDKEMLRYAKELGKSKKMKVIVVNGTLTCSSGSINDMNPVSFLALLQNASIVITNSFHGIALSLIHHRDFYVFMPKAHKDRIYNLLDKYSLQNRIVNSEKNNNMQKIDYSVIDEITNSNREEAINYLKCALT